ARAPPGAVPRAAPVGAAGGRGARRRRGHRVPADRDAAARAHHLDGAEDRRRGAGAGGGGAVDRRAAGGVLSRGAGGGAGAARMTGLAAALAGAARVGPLVAIAPPLGRSWLARAIVGALLVAAMWPALAHAGEVQTSGILPQLIFRELLVGVTLGVLVAVPFRAAEAAGNLLGVAVARSAPGVPPAILDGARNPLGEAYGLFALALFASLSGPRLIASGLAAS